MLWLLPALLAAFSSATISLLSKKSMKSVSYYVVSWALLTLSFPLFLSALFFTEIPEIGQWFWPATVVHVSLFLVSIVLYMRVLETSDLSLTLPILAFSPIFMLVTGPILNGEFPEPKALAGILWIVLGAYLLSFDRKKRGIFAPLKSILTDHGTSLMLVVSLMWAIMASTSKLAVSNSSPLFALTATYALTAFISTPALLLTGLLKIKEVKQNFGSLLAIGVLTFIGNIGLYYSFTLTLAVHAIAVKRLSILIGTVYGFTFFKEKNKRQRLIGVLLMLAGVFLMTL
ncbi:DMT family transporter [archaeon]|nr:DMT family transporter [archaeon]